MQRDVMTLLPMQARLPCLLRAKDILHVTINILRGLNLGRMLPANTLQDYHC